jgi:hypothetical protein
MHIIFCICLSLKLWTRSGSSSCCNLRAETWIVGLLVVALFAPVDCTFLVLPQNRTEVVAGRRVTLHCSTNETSKGVVWECTGKCSRRASKANDQTVIIYNNGRIRDHFDGHATVIRTAPEQFDLHIAQTDELDEGKYSCRDRNGVGYVAVAILTILVPSKPPDIILPGRTTTKAAEASQLSAKSATSIVDSTEAESATTEIPRTTIIITLTIGCFLAAAIGLIVYMYQHSDTWHNIVTRLRRTGTRKLYFL